MARRRSYVFRVLSLVLGVVLGLSLAELVVRILDVRPIELTGKRILLRDNDPSGTMYFCYPTNPDGKFRPLPKLHGDGWRLIYSMGGYPDVPLDKLPETPWCVEVLYRDGMRDRDYPLKPAAGACRILGMGDSFAMGDGVPLEESLFKQMEVLLGGNFEVINGAHTAMDAAQEAATLKFLAARYHAPRALVIFLLNDVQISPTLAQRRSRINNLIDVLTEPAAGSGVRLLDIRRAQTAYRKSRRETIRWYQDCYDTAQNGDNLELLATYIRAMAGVPDCRVGFVMYPLMEGLEDGYPFRAIHDKVRTMAEKCGMPVLDLADAFAGHPTSSFWVHPSDHHPNGKAHAIAAREIVAWLRDKVPGFLEPCAGASENR